MLLFLGWGVATSGEVAVDEDGGGASKAIEVSLPWGMPIL